MRILVAGDWHSELHEEVVQNAFRQLGHDVAAFKWNAYFTRPTGAFSLVRHIVRRAQNKYLVGPAFERVNREFVAAVTRFRPDFIFVYRGTHILPATLRRIRMACSGVVIAGYNNDDPFAPKQPRYLWRHFLGAVPEYDMVFSYRFANIKEYRAAGARWVELLRSWYVPERNHPVTLDAAQLDQFEADVVFVGHYEPDQRREYLEEVVRAGYRLRIFGPGYDWDPVLRKSPWLASQVPVKLVWGEDYNRALCGAKVALCFFSKLNRDTYTRRCFEIPATGTLLLSEYSDDLAGLFSEGHEADYFRNPVEMIEKIRTYVEDDCRRQAVAAAGARRVVADGHDVVSRMAGVVASVLRLRQVKVGQRGAQ